MRNPVSLALMLLTISLAPAAQACEYPPDLKIPDGKSATQEEMSAAVTAMKKYQANMEAYRACLDADYAALPAEQQTPDANALHVKRYNAAVDAETAEATAFNDQVRAFKAAKK
jgi:hypothetical protein